MSLKYNGNLEEAISCFEGAINANPNHSNAYNGKGMILYEQYKYTEALECFNKAIEVDMDNLNLHTFYYNKGNALYFIGKPEEAVLCYEKAIELADTYIYPYLGNGNGNALLKCKRYEESIKYFDKCIKRLFNRADAYLGKGQALFFLNKYDDAIQCYDKVIKLNSQNGLVYLYKGDALIKLNKSTEAKQCYDKAIEINPELKNNIL